MTDTYRAFISYSHRDAKFARQFHSELEGWRVDRDLVGRQTLLGPVPQTLRPIFRDREDFSGGGTLTDAMRDALSDSTFLIVLCSPDAARSDYVNEEIRLFKGMGRAERIIPVIIAGEPGDPNGDCFPSALVRSLGADGELSDERVEPLAADTRDKGDGRRRALAKVVAGLLGVPFDEIAKRSERAQRRRTRILVVVAATMFLLAVAAGGFGWLSESRRAVAERNYRAALSAADSLLGEVGEELIRVEGVQLETTKRVIDRATSILDDLAESLPDALELKVSRVGSLTVFAQALEAKGDKAGAIAKYREAEALAESIATARSNDEGSLAILAMVRWRFGASLAFSDARAEAISKLGAAVDVLGTEGASFVDQPDMQAELVSAAQLLSSLLTYEGRLEEAATYGDMAIEIAEKLRIANPDEWRFRMLVPAIQMGQTELLRKQGNEEAALAMLVDAERRLIELLEARPDYRLRGPLSAVQASLATALDERGDTEAADAARKRSVAAMQLLTRADAENRDARREHADDLAEEAEALAGSGARAESAAMFEESLEILEAMAVESPDDSSVRTSLQLSLSRAAGSLNDVALYVLAEAAARRLLALREAELALAPEDPETLRSMTLALYLLARAVEGNGALEEALALRRRLLSLEEKLTIEPTDNRATLAEAHHSIGQLAWRLSRRAEAIPHYERQAELLAALAAESPSDRRVRVDLGHGLLNLGELRAITGDGTGALAAFRRCLDVRRALADPAFDEPERLAELAWAEARLAQFGDASVARWRRVEALLTTAEESAPLGDWEEELLTVARIALSGTPR